MRRGVTLLEVLFAIGVAALGLLGAVAVFPVALSQARKGRTADVTAVGGESAIATFTVRGMHDTTKWIAWDRSAAAPAFARIDQPPLLGKSFCIDPMQFAHNAGDDPGNSDTWAHFPAVPPTDAAHRLIRISLHDGRPGQPSPQHYMSEVMADRVFRIEDELLYERPADNSLPAAQLFNGIDDGTGTGAKVPGWRQEEGRLTWFATLVPKLDLREYYVLSVVVCRDRAIGEALHASQPWTESVAHIRAGDFHANGDGGGEVTISSAASGAFAGPEAVESLRTGHWVMLSRNIPANGIAVDFQAWYRVSDADDVEFDPASGTHRRSVTLIGGDWPADAACEVYIVPHVAHVYERTVRLD
jgi:hypothetical protein